MLLMGGFFLRASMIEWQKGNLIDFMFLIIFFILTIFGSYVYIYKFIFQPLRYYEQNHGKTGFGDYYLKKWGEARKDD